MDEPKRSTKHYAKNGKRNEHTVLIEAILGKPLPRGAQIHHVNGDRKDNRHCNLVVCQDQRYHYLLHARQRVKDAGGNPNTQRFCYVCGRLCFLVDMTKPRHLSQSSRCFECTRVYKKIEYARLKSDPYRLAHSLRKSREWKANKRRLATTPPDA